jgi:hypothetical protein
MEKIIKLDRFIVIGDKGSLHTNGKELKQHVPVRLSVTRQDTLTWECNLVFRVTKIIRGQDEERRKDLIARGVVMPEPHNRVSANSREKAFPFYRLPPAKRKPWTAVQAEDDTIWRVNCGPAKREGIGWWEVGIVIKDLPIFDPDVIVDG